MSILTEEQCAASRRFYETALTLNDDVVTGYATVILSLLDTIDDLRAALRIERKEIL